MRHRLLPSLFLLICLSAFAVAARNDLPAPAGAIRPAELASKAWRRTTHGWEPRLMWQLHAPRPVNPATRLHPAVVAMFVGLFSVGALWAFERTDADL